MTETCNWCGDSIDHDEERVEVIRRTPGGLNDRRTLAAFHVGELPCYTEARDYGWS